jgi:hypothetical protein
MTFSNVTRRTLIGGLAAGVSAVSVTSSGIGSARAQSTQKTFVLVGGAFYGAWCWHRVTERLEQQGHKVYAFTLTGLAERSHLLSEISGHAHHRHRKSRRVGRPKRHLPRCAFLCRMSGIGCS